MAKIRGTIPGLTEEERRAIEAQTNLTQAQAQALAEETAIKRGQLGIEQQKIGLGERELTGRERQSKRETAAKLAGVGAEAGRTQADILADLIRRPDVTPNVVATTMAQMGNPALYNALAAERTAAQDKAINAFVPQLQQPMEPAEREKKFKAAMEAVRPGGYDLGLARAYPKGVSTEIKPETYTGPVTPAAPGFGELTARLLEGGETTPQPSTAVGPTYSVGVFGGNPPVSRADQAAIQEERARSAAGTLATLATNPRAFADPSVGALEGSRRTDLGNNLTQLLTPSGGEIRFRTPQGERANATLAKFIGPQNAPPAVSTTAAAAPVAPANVPLATAPAPTPGQGILTPAFPGGQSAVGYLVGQLPQGVKDYLSGAVPPEVRAQQQIEEAERLRRLAAQR